MLLRLRCVCTARKACGTGTLVAELRGWLGSGDAVESVSVKRVTMALRCCGVSKPRRAQVLNLQEGGLCLPLLGKWLSLLSLAGAVSKLVGVEEPLRDSGLGQAPFPPRSICFLEPSTLCSSLWDAVK